MGTCTTTGMKIHGMHGMDMSQKQNLLKLIDRFRLFFSSDQMRKKKQAKLKKLSSNKTYKIKHTR